MNKNNKIFLIAGVVSAGWTTYSIFFHRCDSGSCLVCRTGNAAALLTGLIIGWQLNSVFLN